MAVIDDLDGRLIQVLRERPRSGVLELARLLGVARNTVSARLERLAARGIVTGFGPDLDLAALGYGVLAFTSLEIAQGRLSDVVAHLRVIPEVLEAHTTTGPADLHCRIVARSNEHLGEVLGRVLDVQGIGRATTVIALGSQIRYRALPLVGVVAGG